MLPLRSRQHRALSPPGMCIEISIACVFEFAYIVQEVGIAYLATAGGWKQQNAPPSAWLLPGVQLFGPCIDILLNSKMTDRFLSLVQRPNDINYEYRTDIVHNNMIEDTYSVVWKLETQLIIKPRIIIQEESGEKINEQRRKYLVQG